MIYRLDPCVCIQATASGFPAISRHHFDLVSFSWRLKYRQVSVFRSFRRYAKLRLRRESQFSSMALSAADFERATRVFLLIPLIPPRHDGLFKQQFGCIGSVRISKSFALRTMFALFVPSPRLRQRFFKSVLNLAFPF